MKDRSKKELLEENIVLQNRVDHYMTKASIAEANEQSLRGMLEATQRELGELAKFTADRIVPLEASIKTMQQDLVTARKRANNGLHLLRQLSDLASLGVELVKE